MITSRPQTRAITRRSPDRHHFSGPYVTSVGGTTQFNPEIAANLSGGGFSFYLQTPDYQYEEVMKYVQRYQEFHEGLYKCAHYRDLAHPYFVIVQF